MWNSIQNGPYQRPMITNPDNVNQEILKPLSKMTEVDACKNAKEMWERIKRLMFDSDVTTHVRHSCLVDEFDKFTAKEGESLECVYERLTTLVNIMDRNNVRPISAKKVAKNHDPLALIAHLNAYSSQSHANSSYSPQQYYVTHPLSVVDYDDEYQGELQMDTQEDKLTSTMMNQAVVQDGRVDIQTKNADYGGNANKNTGRQNMNQGLMQEMEVMKAIRLFSKPKVRDAKYFREQMLLAIKDKVGSNLINEENDFMLDNSYEEELEELTIAVMLMARL
nr:copia protein [Tanacetum cinerariifolium]